MAFARTLLNNKPTRLIKQAIVALRGLSQEHPHVLCSDHSDVTIPEITFHQYMYEKFQPFYKYTAVECSITGRKYTFEEVRVKSRNLSKSLRKKLKLEKDDIVAIFLPNIPEYIFCCLGIMEAGLVVTTMNPIYTAEEVAKQLLDSNAKAIITLNQSNLVNTAKTAIQIAKKTLPVIAIKEKENDDLYQTCIDFKELTDTNTDIPDLHCDCIDRLAFLPYSSGTTGLPKGVELTHNNLVSNCVKLPIQVKFPRNNTWGITYVPHLWLYGDSYERGILRCENSFYAKVSSRTIHFCIEEHDVTRIYAAPPLAAAPLGPLDEQKFHEKFGGKISVTQGYGLTETSPLVALFPQKYTEETSSCVTGSIGKLVPNTRAKVVSLDDPTGTPLGPNEQGELLLQGPQVMRGYHKKPKETQDTMLDGWLRTGDIVRYNKDRFLFVTDRLKELIKVKGFQVAPAELEELIRAFPAVEEAAVIGVPHSNHGEVPRAYVVPKKGVSLIPEELDKFVAAKVASYKRLSGGIEVVDAIPKNPSGKILRRELKAAYDQKLQVADLVIPRTSLHEFFYEQTEKYHKYTAVECSETGRKYSYLEVRSKARNLSKYLIKKLKLQKGDVVAILSPNVPEYMITCLGILEAGLVITSMNPIYTVGNQSDHYIKQYCHMQNSRGGSSMTKKQLPIIAIKEKSDAPNFHYTDPDALAFLPYSSGTTGLPKGVELLHRNIVANLCTFQEVMPAVLPLFHIYGFTALLFYSGIHGAKLITLPRFSPTPLFLTNHPAVASEYLKNLRTFVSAAAPLGQSDEDKFKKKFGNHISFKQGYGLTEMSPIVCSYLNGFEPKASIAGSVGVPLPATMLKVIDPDDPSGTPLDVHQKGEILVKGPQMMKGYHNRPDETKNAFLDGWLRTGDIGHYNEDDI
nr:unnamed protein product [Callosobruchus analis]